jgi:tripartite-type tricarboxylate transporter receptor subunit TctC
MRTSLIVAWLAGAFALLWPLVSTAQDYPSRPITIIAPFPPGATTDASARLVRDGMSTVMGGKPIIVENRGGAGGTTGSAYVAGAPPDGYTLLITVSAPLTMNKYMQKNFPYDPVTAFAPVSLLMESALFLAVHPSLPVRTVAEFIDYAKKNPGKLSYGTSGLGSAHHIAGELIKQKTGIDMVHVPYKGGGPVIQDLIANNIPVGFGTAPAVLPQAQAGLIRIIATTRSERLPDLPEIPTISETIPGVVTTTWVALLAPAGTPKPIVAKLNETAVAALRDKDLIAKFKVQGMTVKTSTPAELDERIRTELDMWGKIVPALGIPAE